MKKHNRHLLRRVSAVLMTAALVLGMTACGQSKFDASGYLDASIKAVITGDASGLDAYSKVAVTDLPEAYAGGLQTAMKELTEESDLPEEVQKEFQELLTSVVNALSYTVGEAKEITEGSASGYEVPVVIKPLELNVSEKFTEWSNSLEMDESDLDDLDALYETVYKEVATLLKDALAEGKYGEEQTVTISITKNEDGLYEINQDDMQEAMETAITTDLESMLQE